jgi:hypothetical protein
MRFIVYLCSSFLLENVAKNAPVSEITLDAIANLRR